jgi:hypothetical protein
VNEAARQLGTSPFLGVVGQLMEMVPTLNSLKEVGIECGKWVGVCSHHIPEGRVWFDAKQQM